MTTLRAILLVSILLLTTGIVSAEQLPEPDIVLLDSGAEIKGEVIVDIPDDKVVVRRRDNTEMEIPYDRIIAVTDEAGIAQARELLKNRRATRRLNFEWMNHTRLGLVFGQGSPLVWVSSTNGVLLSERLYLGAGLGWEHYDHVEAIPVLLEMNYLLNRWWRFDPFVAVSVGYAFAWHNHMHGSDFGGVVCDLGGGVRLPLSRGPKLSLLLGMRICEGKGLFSEFETISNSYILGTFAVGMMF
jgi:hypothetical protein